MTPKKKKSEWREQWKIRVNGSETSRMTALKLIWKVSKFGTTLLFIFIVDHRPIFFTGFKRKQGGMARLVRNRYAGTASNSIHSVDSVLSRLYFRLLEGAKDLVDESRTSLFEIPQAFWCAPKYWPHIHISSNTGHQSAALGTNIGAIIRACGSAVTTTVEGHTETRRAQNTAFNVGYALKR